MLLFLAHRDSMYKIHITKYTTKRSEGKPGMYYKPSPLKI